MKNVFGKLPEPDEQEHDKNHESACCCGWCGGEYDMPCLSPIHEISIHVAAYKPSDPYHNNYRYVYTTVSGFSAALFEPIYRFRP